MSISIDYGNLMDEAMRGLIRKVLSDVEANGLPGEHHFFVTFDTREPGVEIADWLQERFPETMTIVIQNWFEDLQVGQDKFEITLNFSDQPEHLVIPFDALRTFVDPSVEFGLRFETQGPDETEAEAAETPKIVEPVDEDNGDEKTAKKDASDTDKSGDAEVVSLDAFRKT